LHKFISPTFTWARLIYKQFLSSHSYLYSTETKLKDQYLEDVNICTEHVGVVGRRGENLNNFCFSYLFLFDGGCLLTKSCFPGLWVYRWSDFMTPCILNVIVLNYVFTSGNSLLWGHLWDLFKTRKHITTKKKFHSFFFASSIRRRNTHFPTRSYTYLIREVEMHYSVWSHCKKLNSLKLETLKFLMFLFAVSHHKGLSRTCCGAVTRLLSQGNSVVH
jgi:hypothetical protein